MSMAFSRPATQELTGTMFVWPRQVAIVKTAGAQRRWFSVRFQRFSLSRQPDPTARVDRL